LKPIPLSIFGSREESSPKKVKEDLCYCFKIVTLSGKFSRPFIFHTPTIDIHTLRAKYMSLEVGETNWEGILTESKVVLQTFFSPDIAVRGIDYDKDLLNNKECNLSNIGELFCDMSKRFSFLERIDYPTRSYVHPFLSSTAATQHIRKISEECLVMRLSSQNKFNGVIISYWNKIKNKLSNNEVTIDSDGKYLIKLKEDEVPSIRNSLSHVIAKDYSVFFILDQHLFKRSFGEIFPDYVHPKKENGDDGYLSELGNMSLDSKTIVQHRGKKLGEISVDSKMTVSQFLQEIEKQLGFTVLKLWVNDVPIPFGQHGQFVCHRFLTKEDVANVE